MFRTATGDARPSEVKVFDYIYGVLHSPEYRETYKEFLKIDFPRIPYPKDPATFAHISEKGEALRRLHLMEAGAIGDTPYPFDGDAPEDGDSIVDKPRFVASTVIATPGLNRGKQSSVARTDSGLPRRSAPRNDDIAGAVGRVFINGKGDKGQYFDGVPELAWEFYIGGYQPAQKWLKDRKGRELSYDDIGHYQKIIKILARTDEIMKEIKLPLD